MKFRGTNNIYVVMYLVSITHTTRVHSYSLYLVEKSSLCKVRIIPPQKDHTSHPLNCCGLCYQDTTLFFHPSLNGYCKLFGPSRYKLSQLSTIQNATYHFVSRLRKMSLLLTSVWIKPSRCTTMMDKCRGCQNILLAAPIPN
jgi:hypothetical protein